MNLSHLLLFPFGHRILVVPQALNRICKHSCFCPARDSLQLLISNQTTNCTTNSEPSRSKSRDQLLLVDMKHLLVAACVFVAAFGSPCDGPPPSPEPEPPTNQITHVDNYDPDCGGMPHDPSFTPGPPVPSPVHVPPTPEHVAVPHTPHGGGGLIPLDDGVDCVPPRNHLVQTTQALRANRIARDPVRVPTKSPLDGQGSLKPE
jgi:hypothetical protein